MPELDTAQRLGLTIHAPERAHVPSQTLAHSPQYSRSGLFDRGRFRQDLRDRVLHAEAFLGTLTVLDVEADAVPLDHLSVLVTSRLAANPMPSIVSIDPQQLLFLLERF